MATTMDTLSHKAQRAAFGVALDMALKHIEKDTSKGLLDVLDISQKFMGDTFKKETFEATRAYISTPENKWMQFVTPPLHRLHPNVIKTTALNLGFEAAFRGTKTIRKMRQEHHCNIPWLILMDPTAACNMRCTGCWAAEYGHNHNLTFEQMDDIITQGKELGIYFYMFTGGEPLVRKKDILRLCEKHYDVEFHSFTNSTLIDEEFCKECVRVGNLSFSLSLEGFEEANDGRRGAGHFNNVMRAMDLMNRYGLIYGTSVCYTRANAEVVTSDEFLDLEIEKGCMFSWYFHFMPTGNGASPELMPTPEQRKYMIKRIREIRANEGGKQIYTMDFQNDGEFVGGCIAGGRNYFHINSNGDAEPCVFIHYSNVNIKDHTLLEVLKSPLFMAYHREQPFNRDHLRPCPMLENPQMLRKMVEESGAHSTDMESPESVDHLCAKCDDYAAAWAPVAKEIWAEQKHKKPSYTNYDPAQERGVFQEKIDT